MLKNYLKIAFRNLIRNKVFSFINLSGLAIGLACCLIILLFVQSESGYDWYHTKKDNLYRLSLEVERLASGEKYKGATSSILWAPALKKEYPEITEFCRFMEEREARTFQIGNQKFTEEKLVFADRTAFDLFSWPMIAGDPGTALTEPYSIVLNETLARTYFGDEDALGKTILSDHIENDDGKKITRQLQFKVTGIIKDIPHKSHLKPNMLISFKTLNDFFDADVESGVHPETWFWRGRIAHNYLLFKGGTRPADFETKMPAFLDKYVGDATETRGYEYYVYLQPVEDIHLEGQIFATFEQGGDKTQIYLFSVIALFILAIACINFMNLSTARSVARAREVGVRKVVGANRKKLIEQFIGESVILSFMALLLALILVDFLNPIFYHYLQRQFFVDNLDLPVIVLAVLFITTFVGVAAGSYPAFFLSGFRPASVLKSAQGSRGRGAGLRKALVILQFAITVFFIFGSLTIYNQLNFMRTQSLGVKTDQILVIPPAVAEPVLAQSEAIRNELLSSANINSISFSSALPGRPAGGDIWAQEGQAGQEGVSLDEFAVDHDFIEMYGLQIIAGRTFRRDMATDEAPKNVDGPGYELAGIVNEAALRQFGWNSPEEALGKKVRRDPVSNDFSCHIIGVVKDFHFDSLHEEIEPMILYINPHYASDYRHISVELAPASAGTTIDFIKNTLSPKLGEVAFDYFFVDENFNELYKTDERMVEIFGYISVLTIFVACLGLFGLASFSAEQRTKEIGVRKVLGANVPGIVRLLSKDFVKLVFVSIVIACPAAYFVMRDWLTDFAYRYEIGPGLFTASAFIALAIAMLTVSSQAVRAALVNPADSLKYE